MSDGTAGAVTARPAGSDDVPQLLRLYRLLEAEMAALRPTWPVADGLAEPVDQSLDALLAAPDWEVIAGSVDGVVVGFLAWRDEALLPQAEGARLGSVRFIFTETEARGIGVGEAMMTEFLAAARRCNITRFDAHVSPGHREAKNFFESNGFKARSIVMHRDDERP